MNNVIIVGLIVSIIFGASSFIASNNYIVAACCFLITLLYFVIFARQHFKKYQIKIVILRRLKELLIHSPKKSFTIHLIKHCQKTFRCFLKNAQKNILM